MYVNVAVDFCPCTGNICINVTLDLHPYVRQVNSVLMFSCAVFQIRTTSLDVNLAEVRQLETSIWKEMIADQQATNKKVFLV